MSKPGSEQRFIGTGGLMQERMVSHYKIFECLGGGAMGKVFKAEDTLLHRLVALKFLPADLTGDEEASRRFMREARATSSLDHPNICTIHEIAQDEDDNWYIAMAWYEGRTLKKILENGPLPPVQALDYARQAALGLSRAHNQNVVHRDIKPANIIITDRDELKILDFGLARLLGKARLTRSGTVMGTAAYMSPEQARGEDVGTASDIWSLGVVLYEMLSGRTPFEGESDVAVIYSVLNCDPLALPEPVCRNGEICTGIIRNCLTRDPRDRYRSARDLANDIKRGMEGSRIAYGPRPSRSSVFAPPARPLWRQLLPAVFVLVLLIVLALPQSRRFLRSVAPFASNRDQTGVAVVPFTFTGDKDDVAAFGRGLSTLINDRLSALEQYSGRFWVVPSDEITRRDIVDGERAQSSQGVEQVITGEGSLNGNIITLEVTVFDIRDNSHKSREFKDSTGNLKTWQRDVLSWLTGVIDSDLEAPPDIISGTHCTNIPASFVAYQYGLGHLAAASGDPDNPHIDAAMSYLERAVASDSSYACAWTRLGRAVWLKYGISDSARMSQVEAYLTTAARLDSTAVWPHHYLGSLKASTGDSVDSHHAMVEYRLALTLDPLHAPTLCQLGFLQNRLGDYKGAKDIFYRAIEARPYSPRAYRNAGVFHSYRAEYEKMGENFQTMVDLAPDDYLGYYLLGAAYFEKGDYDNSENLTRHSLAIEPTHGAYSNLGTLYYYDQRYNDSIAMCRKALEIRPNDLNSWRTLAASFKFAPGYVDSVRPAYERAMELLQVELIRDPENTFYAADHAAFCAILGPRETALAILADLETGNPELDPGVMFSMASTYEELGDRDRALDWLETAVYKSLSFKKVDHYPILKNLRSHPRYIALREQYRK